MQKSPLHKNLAIFRGYCAKPREVHILAERPRAVYRVAETTLQRFFGGGFYLAGNVPRSYSPDGVRMIVPADTENRYAASSLAEAI